MVLTGQAKTRAIKTAFIALVLITSAAVLSAISFVLLATTSAVFLASSSPEGLVFFLPAPPVSVAVPGFNPLPFLITILLGCALGWAVMGGFIANHNKLAANSGKQV